MKRRLLRWLLDHPMKNVPREVGATKNRKPVKLGKGHGVSTNGVIVHLCFFDHPMNVGWVVTSRRSGDACRHSLRCHVSMPSTTGAKGCIPELAKVKIHWCGCVGQVATFWRSRNACLFSREIRSPSGAPLGICYDWAKENNRRMSRAKRPVLWLKPFRYDWTKIRVPSFK